MWLTQVLNLSAPRGPKLAGRTNFGRANQFWLPLSVRPDRGWRGTHFGVTEPRKPRPLQRASKCRSEGVLSPTVSQVQGTESEITELHNTHLFSQPSWGCSSGRQTSEFFLY